MLSRRCTTAQKMLESAGLYRTKGRIAILSVLLESSKPLRQEEIASRLRLEMLDRTTVYRTLSALVKAELVHKAYLSKRAWHFELANQCTERQCHPHFTCTKCGATYCLTEMSIPIAEGVHEGFVIQRQQVRFEGLCPKCS